MEILCVAIRLKKCGEVTQKVWRYGVAIWLVGEVTINQLFHHIVGRIKLVRWRWALANELHTMTEPLQLEC